MLKPLSFCPFKYWIWMFIGFPFNQFGIWWCSHWLHQILIDMWVTITRHSWIPWWGIPGTMFIGYWTCHELMDPPSVHCSFVNPHNPYNPRWMYPKIWVFLGLVEVPICWNTHTHHPQVGGHWRPLHIYHINLSLSMFVLMVQSLRCKKGYTIIPIFIIFQGCNPTCT